MKKWKKQDEFMYLNNLLLEGKEKDEVYFSEKEVDDKNLCLFTF